MQKKLKRMTSMEQTEALAVEARKHGMKYGEFVEKYGEWIPSPKKIQVKAKKRDIAEHKKRESNERKEMICQECGKTYLAGSSTAMYCPGCRSIVQKRRAKEKREERRKNKPATCKRCGKAFVKNSNRQLYCEECQKVVFVEQRRENQRWRRKEKRNREKEKMKNER